MNRDGRAACCDSELEKRITLNGSLHRVQGLNHRDLVKILRAHDVEGLHILVAALECSEPIQTESLCFPWFQHLHSRVCEAATLRSSLRARPGKVMTQSGCWR